MSTILTTEQIKQRQELTRKMIDESITKDEAKKLKHILELEKTKAVELKDYMSLLAIAFLMRSVNAHAVDDIRRLINESKHS